MPPPPPGPLTRRISASLAGLEFTRQLFRHWVPQEAPLGQGHPGGYGIAIFLTGCAPALPNCRLAKEKGVLNWTVTAVNGVRVGNDLGAFETAFQSTPAGQKVKLTLQYENDMGAPPAVTRLDISFDPK
ncbi:MAG: hypothetical protein WCE20_07725 [Rhizomicrobium sp.]